MGPNVFNANSHLGVPGSVDTSRCNVVPAQDQCNFVTLMEDLERLAKDRRMANLAICDKVGSAELRSACGGTACELADIASALRLGQVPRAPILAACKSVRDALVSACPSL